MAVVRSPQQGALRGAEVVWTMSVSGWAGEAAARFPTFHAPGNTTHPTPTPTPYTLNPTPAPYTLHLHHTP
eukprot:140685-Chlamydomonas_euryale.AAC.1